MPNEEMGSRTLPEPPGVATGIVMIAVAAFLGFVAVMMAVPFFYLKAGMPHALERATEHPFPEPALQKTPQDDLKQFELEQRLGCSDLNGLRNSERQRRMRAPSTS